jgi:hypothetical protein
MTPFMLSVDESYSQEFLTELLSQGADINDKGTDFDYQGRHNNF